jgi:hypothetical protein
MNLHRKSIQDRRQNRITRKPKATGEKSRNTTTSPSSGTRICSSSGARPVPEGKKPAASYSLIMLVVTFDSPKTREEGRGPAGLVLTKSPTPASTSPTSSSSILTSPFSWLLEPLAVGEPPLWEVEHSQDTRQSVRLEDQPRQVLQSSWVSRCF